jgi:Iron-sulfur cluster-binding domain
MDMRKKICPVPWQHMEIGYDHNVYLCCHIPTPVGNLAEHYRSDDTRLSYTHVAQVWKGEKAEEVRASILDGSYKFCNKKTCPVLDQPLDLSPHEWWQNTLAFYPQDIAGQRPNWRISIAPWPRRISLANDKSCNLSCQSCRNERLLDDKNPKLDLVLRRLLNSGVLEYAEVLKLNGAGEFVHSAKLLAFVKECFLRYPQLKLELLSNMTTFDAEMFYKLGFRHKVRQLWGSIDASSSGTYAKVRGGNFRAVIRHLDSFVRIRRDEGFRLIIGFVVSSKNFREMPAFAEMAEERGIEAEFMGIQDWGHLPPDEYKALDITTKWHPQHQEFLYIMRTTHLQHGQKVPVFLSPHVKLGNLLRFVEE